MTLQDLFDQLSTSELSQMRLGDERTEGITETNAHAIVPAVNLALTALHRRFRLREARMTIQLVPGQESYAIQPGANLGSALQIERVVWPPEFQPEAQHREPYRQGASFPLNEEGDAFSLFTPTPTSLRVPLSVQEAGLTEVTVVYRANHPRIVYQETGFDPATIEVDLPETHVEALLLHVAMRLTTPLGSAQEGFHEGNNYAAKYEQACRALEQGGYQVKVNTELTRFHNLGWV